MQNIKCFRVNYLVVFCAILILPLSSSPEGLNAAAQRFTFKLDNTYKEEILQELQRQNFNLLFEITPTTYILEYTGNPKYEPKAIVQFLLQSSNGKIIAAEPVRVYRNDLTPVTAEYFRSHSTDKETLTTRRFIVKVRKANKAFLFSKLKSYQYVWISEITPRISVFEYMGQLRDLHLDRLTGQIRARFKKQIISIEKVDVYENTLKPQEIYEATSLDFSERKKTSEIDNHYGMAVSRAHALGYTGKGVVVAITDVGVDTDNLDLMENIDKELCFNYFDNNRNVSPEYFHNLQDISTPITAHGDHCGSIIGSVRGNDICTFGISYKATIVGLKIFNVTLNYGRYFSVMPNHKTRSDVIAGAFTHRLSEIHIFSNSWAPTKSFTTLQFPVKDAIEHGALKGRHGLGTIYVVPAGPVGFELANNIYTITINGVGQNWTVPADSSVSASVITSGLSSGSNLTSSYLVTTSQRDKCVTSFKGVSAATAEIAAIIALALEANSNLTMRKLKGLLVYASELDETRHNISTNAAGHKFHMVFGFGLLNAERLVLLAKKSVPPLPLQKRSLKEAFMWITDSYEQEAAFCYKCDMINSDTCLDTIEEVVIKMKLTNKCKRFRMTLVSPSGTESVLVPLEAILTEEQNKKIQLASVHFWNERPFGIWRLFLSYPPDSCSDRVYIQDVSLTLFGTQILKSTQHPAVSCAGLWNFVHFTNETSGKEESTLNKLLHIKLNFSTVILIVIGFSIGTASVVLRLTMIYRARQQFKKRKDEKHTRAL